MAIGLNDRLPISLVHTSSRMSVERIASKPAASSAYARCLAAPPAVAENVMRVRCVMHFARRAYFGCDVNDAPDDVLRRQGREHGAVRIQRTQRRAFQRAARAMEVPPRQTVDRRNDDGLLCNHQRRMRGNIAAIACALLTMTRSWHRTAGSSPAGRR